MFTVKSANNNYYYALGGGCRIRCLKVAGNSYGGREDAVHVKSGFAAGRCMKSNTQNHGGALLPSEDGICRSHLIQF